MKTKADEIIETYAQALNDLIYIGQEQVGDEPPFKAITAKEMIDNFLAYNEKKLQLRTDIGKLVDEDPVYKARLQAVADGLDKEQADVAAAYETDEPVEDSDEEDYESDYESDYDDYREAAKDILDKKVPDNWGDVFPGWERDEVKGFVNTIGEIIDK